MQTHYKPTPPPDLTERECGKVIGAQHPDERTIVINATTLDGPIIEVGNVHTLAAFLRGIREGGDACDPYVHAPNKYKTSQMLTLDYWMTDADGGVEVILRWPDGSTARGFFSLPDDSDV